MKPFSNHLIFAIIFLFLTISSVSAQNDTITEQFNLSMLDLPDKSIESYTSGASNQQFHVYEENTLLQLQNTPHNLQATFLDNSVNFTKSNYSWILQLLEYGFSDAPQISRSEATYTENNVIYYQHDDMVEWYINGSSGIQQGFTFYEVPEGIRQDTLTITLQMTTNLQPVLINQTLKLYDRNGSIIFIYDDLIAFDANGLQLPVSMHLENNRLYIIADTSSAIYPVTIDPYVMTQKILNPTPNNVDRFGSAVAIDGNNVLIGALFDDAGATDAGAAYLFDLAGNLQQTILNPTPSAIDGEEFGSAVAIDGNNVLIGAPGDDVLASDSGAVYLYDLSGTLQQTIVNPSPNNGDEFGSAVAIDGNNIIIASRLDDAGGVNSGAVYLYDLSGTLQQTIINPSPNNGDLFGASVAIDGNNIIIGSPFDGTSAGTAGIAYVFDLSGTLQQTIVNPSPAIGDRFGSFVTLDGTNVLVGAPFDDAGALDAGIAYVFDLSGTLQQTIANPAPENGDNFGESIGIAGNNILIGATNEDTGASDAGTAYVFDLSGTLQQTIFNPTPSDSSSFTRSIALSGINAIISATGDNTGAGLTGAAYLYSFSSSVVTVTANVPSAIENPIDNGQFTIDLGTINNTGNPIIVNYNVGGTATSGTDFIALSGSATIPDGQQSITIDVVPIDDIVVDPVETVILTLISTSNSSYVVDLTPATVTITDDDLIATIPIMVTEQHDSEVVVSAIAGFEPVISKLGFLVPRDIEASSEMVEWTVTVTNIGSVNGKNVTVTDTLLDTLQLDHVNAPNAVITITEQTIRVTYQELGVGDTVTFRIFTSVSSDETINNTACVSADNQNGEICSTSTFITELPNTGELPYWRNLLVCAALILMVALYKIYRGHKSKLYLQNANE